MNRKMRTPTIFDSEVTRYDWLFVFKNYQTKIYDVFHNDNDAIREYIKNKNPLLCGFNNKGYDQFILKAILAGADVETVKAINDWIISGNNGWDYDFDYRSGIYFDQFDLMDDCQVGLSLKAIEAHLGMDITETTVSFDVDHPWSKQELDEMIYYCKHDVDATEKLMELRSDYLKNKIAIGQKKGISPEKSLYMTNAKLTAAYLDAKAVPHDDEREYKFPPTLKLEYIPKEVLDFFDRIHNPDIPSEELFEQKLDITVGGCPCKVAWGGIHGAIPNYCEEE